MFGWLKDSSWDSITANKNYQDMLRFSAGHSPAEGKSYRWVYDHAVRQYEDISESINGLDRKADSMIRYLAPSSGIVGLIFGYIAAEHHPALMVSAGVELCLVLASMALAVLSLMPTTQCMMTSVINALTAAEYYATEEKALGSFAGGIGLAIEAKVVANEIKARRLQWSYWIFAVALVWLFLVIPLVYGITKFIS